MTDNDELEAQEWLQPGHWPSELARTDLPRLVALARRRLVGHEHHAEDVVSRSLIKWARIPESKRGVARIEQVIKSEAYSLLRSIQRARARDTSIALHPAGNSDPDDGARSLALLRQAMAETCKRHRIPVTDADVELLELLVAGLTQEQAARAMGIPRHEVRRSRATWQRVLRLTDLAVVGDDHLGR
jgi:DNA-directed RNA polymerase specialized sigma24 family protein